MQNEGDTFGTGEGGCVAFGLFLHLMLGNDSIVSGLGYSRTFNLQSILPCGQFGHLAAFCPVAAFPFWLLPSFSIFRSTKQFYLALNFHTK